MSELREQVYRDPRPPESMRPFHEWAQVRELYRELEEQGT